MNRIGERIKQKRELLGWQLNELARKVGISSSALSQIEKAKSQPTIITLKLIAESLKTTVGELVGENENLLNNPVFRSDEIHLLETNEGGSELFSLSYYDVAKQMDAFKIRIPKDADSIGLCRHCTGQIFAFLLSGEIQFDIDNKSYLIQPGDTLYFNARRNFRLLNISNQVSELICVSASSNS